MKKLVMSSLALPILFSCASAMQLPRSGVRQSREDKTLRVFRDPALRAPRGGGQTRSQDRTLEVFKDLAQGGVRQSREDRTLEVFRDPVLEVKEKSAGKPRLTAVADEEAAAGREVESDLQYEEEETSVASLNQRASSVSSGEEEEKETFVAPVNQGASSVASDEEKNRHNEQQPPAAGIVDGEALKEAPADEDQQH
ncbi:MAG: hypothetical protein LBO73_04035 [Holosporaceae bacterium]|nr:hypothetical protein [Holosporaceae bacterium]